VLTNLLLPIAGEQVVQTVKGRLSNSEFGRIDYLSR